jgi:hypothetical protein
MNRLCLSGSAQYKGGGSQEPPHECLILPHILQVDKDERPEARVCNTSQPFQMVRQPAGPSCVRARRATQTSEFPPEGAHRHAGRRLPPTVGHHRQHQRLNHLMSWALWFGTGVATNLQQAHGKRGQQARASVSAHQPEALAVAQCDSHPHTDDPHRHRLLACSWLLRGEARASTSQRPAATGSNDRCAHGGLSPRRDGSPDWERLAYASAKS